jgi:DNA-binding NarL/FixJ family response regulator
MPTRVLIVDHHSTVRLGLAAFISTAPDMAVCGQAADATQAMSMLEVCRPDVVVLDIQLPTGNGLELVERIKAHDHTVRVLVWSFHADQVHAQLALSAGASGHLSKNVSISRILDAIRGVRDGRIFLCEDAAE